MASKQLLLIDDNEDCRTLVKFALEMNSRWKVSLAATGIEGIVKAEQLRPDLILLDLVMPDLDGLTVYDVLKTNLFTCSIPVVFVTAMVHGRAIARLNNTLADGVITKPFDFVSLDFQIAKICN